MNDWQRVLGDAKFLSDSPRFRALVDEALSRFPESEPTLRSVTKIQLKKRSSTSGLVGLTTYCCVEREENKNGGRERANDGKQRITFYSELLSQLSDAAAIGVIAHELAHASLNERVGAEASRKREKEADQLARKWGYGRYLDALEAETL
jgi:hypothetical protein